jgi:hypothetical protein
VNPKVFRCALGGKHKKGHHFPYTLLKKRKGDLFKTERGI